MCKTEQFEEYCFNEVFHEGKASVCNYTYFREEISAIF